MTNSLVSYYWLWFVSTFIFEFDVVCLQFHAKFWGYTKSSGPNLGTFTYDIYISNGHQAFSGTSSLEKKTVCSFHSEYSSAETNSNTHFGYGFGSRQMGQGLFLNSHFSFASIVCFCFLRLTLFFRCTFIWFHLFHTYQFIEKEEKVWLVWLISLCFLDRKVLLIFEGFTFDYLSLVSL